MIEVVNRHSWKGAGGVYIGRGTPLGNKFEMRGRSDRERDRVCNEYEAWLRAEFKKNSKARAELLRLVEIAKVRDLVLVCSCKPKRCHGDFVKYAIEKLMAK